ncbi:DNA glycosylase [Gymnopilus junonius]|uniref:DNA glycosylase n=1 Tax=Gymnopilus junonius TaxID=109634 RepID=A0A9P5NU00_GYMJU|nr:DNA glycosylase [Gymnopilus junonius]
MPAIRRSSARLAGKANAATSVESQFQVQDNGQAGANSPAKTTRRRKIVSTASDSAAGPSENANQNPQISTSIPCAYGQRIDEEVVVPAVLSFNFEEAKQHLIQVDQRFEDLFAKMAYSYNEVQLKSSPSALATSILGQQISWLAARSITHKFIRLYDASLPEKPTDEERQAITFFPTPYQVAHTDIAILRTAGLSARKAEYIQDLAARFADGRLSTQKLLEADDEQLAQMLIEVRGIGRWTVDMFAIFSLRRPDILPVGDLGVQRGVVRWFLSLHSPLHSYSLSPQKLSGAATPKAKKNDESLKADAGQPSQLEDKNEEAGASSVVPGASAGAEDLPSIPPAFTPSIKKTLDKIGGKPDPLPAGIEIGLLKGRLDGKKIKGAFLTPQEMVALTECWKPYRSLGVYYMWSLGE